MEFTLVPAQRAEFQKVSKYELNPGPGSPKKVTVSVQISENSGQENPTKLGEKYATKLCNSLKKCHKNSIHPLAQQTSELTVDVMVYGRDHPKENVTSAHLMITTPHIYPDSDNNIFSLLKKVCGGLDNFTLDYHVEFLAPFGPEFAVTGKDKKMTMQEFSGKIELCVPFEFPNWGAAGNTRWDDWEPSECGLEIGIRLNDDAVNLLHEDNLPDSLGIYKTILTNKAFTDMSIVGGDGKEIRCHKCFLSAHSPVFEAMFGSSMQEGITSVLKMPDMTEAGVHALLSYLYCWDLTAALKNCDIGLQLLSVADRFNIQRLKGDMLEMILAKDSTWFTVDVAVQIFQFARTKLGCEGEQNFHAVMEKTTAVLKSKSAQELNDSAVYQELFEDPKFGMEFCSFFMTSK